MEEAYKTKMVDKLVARMRKGEKEIYFRDDDLFGESMFDVYSILKDKVKILEGHPAKLLYVDEYIYLWEGDHVVLMMEGVWSTIKPC